MQPDVHSLHYPGIVRVPVPAIMVQTFTPPTLSDMSLRARVSVNSRCFWLLAESAGGTECLHIRTSWEMA